MDVVLEAGAVSLAVGVVVAVLVAGFLVPFGALQTGTHTLDRRAVLRWASVTGYVAAVAAATLAPFPAPGELTCPAPGVQAQWLPLHVLTRIGAGPAGAPGLDPALVQVGLNVLLFTPLGGLLVRAWGMPWVRVVAVAAVVSVGIEVTQLSGVWFVYDCAYRVFDVDDVLANALGAALGAMVVGRVLSGRERARAKLTG